MENWKNFQIEASQDALILEELKKLERIDEASMAAIAKKVGVPVAKVALLLSLMTGVGGGTAEAGRLSDMLGGGNADAPAQQAEVGAGFSKDYGNNATGEISDNGDGTYNVKANSGKILPGSDTWMERAGKLSSEGVAKQLIRDFSAKNPELNLGTDWEFEEGSIGYGDITGDIGNKHIVFTGKLVPKTK